MRRPTRPGPSYAVVARSDDRVEPCKRTLLDSMRHEATEFGIVVHGTEETSVSALCSELDDASGQPPDLDGAAETTAESRYVGTLPDDGRLLDRFLGRMDDSGDLPVTSIELVGERFEVVVTSSTSHSHVGRVETDDEELLGRLTGDLSGVGVVVPDRPTLAWDAGDRYWELDAHELCGYAERPDSDADRATTTHSCHDLTRLVRLDADSDAGRFDLTWANTGSLAGRAIQAVFGRPPTELPVPAEQFDAIETYLRQFVTDEQ
jgi:hypothetical protein